VKLVSEIDAKMADIEGLVTANMAAMIREKLANPERVLCPLVKRYVNLPAYPCTGYRHVCMHLRDDVMCNHPEMREWREVFSSPTIKVYSR
jgi:hypothetical protein